MELRCQVQGVRPELRNGLQSYRTGTQIEVEWKDE